MSLNRLRHSVLAIWLGLFAITVISLGQVQLSGSVVAAAAETHQQADAVDHGPDCPMGKTGGHTHKGHADCAVCGVQATLTSVALAHVLIPAPPSELISAAPVATPTASRAGLSTSPYKSRGPPAAA